MSNKNNECIVVIPTHKETMTNEEERAFRNTLDVLYKWDIALLLPKGVSSSYYEALQVKDGLKFQILSVCSEWMGSLERYNNMASSSEFYQIFKTYQYILICHLDVWVFRDELQIWLDKGYDYIGAPWFLLRDHNSMTLPGNNGMPLDTLMYPIGGNGGFCLRKVKKMVELTTKRKFHWYSFNISLFVKTVLYYLKNKRKALLKEYLRDCREVLRDAKAFQKKYNIYEDRMFCMFYSLIDKNFRIAPAHEELSFCTEVYTDEILKTKLKWQLPFAIHGYQKFLPSITSIDEHRNDDARNNYTGNIRKEETRKQKVNHVPLITVVTATYNLIQSGRIDTFRQSIESVHNQTYKNIEHIIIDGASTDGTLGIIHEYVDKGWCICYSESDNGIWDALYKGHQRASGQFVNYMNSDDYFCCNDAVEVAVNSLVKKNADWFFSGGKLILENGKRKNFPTSRYAVFTCGGIIHQTMFIRTGLLRAINPFHSKHITRENYLIMLLIINRFKYAYSKKTLVHYRVGGYSSNEYGGDNILFTKNDFGVYFYDCIGQFWGMTLGECSSMYSWNCFRFNGIRYSYNISKKLRIRRLQFAFRKKLVIFIIKHKLLKLKKTIKIISSCISRGSLFLECKIKQLQEEENIRKLAYDKGISPKIIKALIFAGKIYLRLLKMVHQSYIYKWCEQFISRFYSKYKTDSIYKRIINCEQKLFSEELSNIILHINVMIQKPSFSIILNISKSSEGLNDILKSINQQIYTNYDIYILCDRNNKQFFNDKNLIYITSIEEVNGDFVVLLGIGQTLSTNALYEFANAVNINPCCDLIYGDEDRINFKGKRYKPFYKPDWSPDYLETFNYISFTACFRTKIAVECSNYLNLYDFTLKFTEKTLNIHHIKKIIGHQYDNISPNQNKIKLNIKSIQKRLNRTGRSGSVYEHEKYHGCYDIQLNLKRKPLVSIIIPTAGKILNFNNHKVDLITNIANQICNNTTYRNIEIIVVDNGDLSCDQIGKLRELGCALITYKEPVFNISKKLNIGANIAKGKLLLLMNDDIEIINPNWIERMVEHFEKTHVGVVGCKLLYENGTIQHVGIVYNSGNPEHVRLFYPGDESGYFNSTCGVRNYSAVSGAVMMTRAGLYHDVGGYSEEFAVNYNDVDFCLKTYKKGYFVLYVPKTELVHMESQSRIASIAPEETVLYQKKWASFITSDKYYNEEFLTVTPATFKQSINKRRF